MLPALAIAEALVDAGHDAVGDPLRRRPAGHRDRACCRRRRIPHTFLDVVGLQRRAQPPQRPAQRRRCCRSCATATRRARAPAAAAAAARSSCRSAATPACRPCSPPAGCGIPIVVVSYDRRPGRASALTARLAAASRRGLPGLAAAAGRRHRRPGAAPDPRRRPRRRPADGAAARSACPPTASSSPSPAARRARRRSTRPSPRYVAGHADDTGLAVRQVVGDRFLAAAPPPRDGSDGVLHQVVGYDDRIELALRRRRPARRAGRGEHRRRGRRHRHAGDPRAVVGRRRGPPDAERALAVRPGRRRSCSPRPSSPRSATSIDELRADPARLAALGERAARRRRRCTAAAPLVERHRAAPRPTGGRSRGTASS